jgi:hypothetical protein
MKLKYETVKTIEVSDWDKFVKDHYGKPYSFQQQDGCKERGVEHISVPDEDCHDYENDTITEGINGPEEGVSFKSWLARDPEEWNGDPSRKSMLSLFWVRNFYPHVSMIINDLYKKGLLEKGEYVINIDW